MQREGVKIVPGDWGTMRFEVIGKLREYWECRCPDCSEGSHYGEPRPITMIIEAEDSWFAAEYVKDISIENWLWEEGDWVEKPQVTMVS